MSAHGLPEQRRVLTAHNMLKDSIHHFLLYRFNFPFEATRCLPPLSGAIELLLRSMHRTGSATAKLVELIETCEDWTTPEKQIAHWVRIRRNELLHGGEPPWEEFSTVTHKTRAAFLLCGGLLTALGHPPDEVFTPHELPVLQGELIYPHDEAAHLAQAASAYARLDPEIAVDIANAAFELSIRELSASWDVPPSSALSLGDLIHHLLSYEDERNPYYEFSNEFDEIETRQLGDGSFNPPMSLANLETLLTRNTMDDLPTVVSRYISEIQKIVPSYAERSPLRVHRCVTANWLPILSALRARRPEIEVPDVDLSRWEPQNFMYRRIQVILHRDAQLPSWDSHDAQAFLDAVAQECGRLPRNVTVEFSRGIAEWI